MTMEILPDWFRLIQILHTRRHVALLLAIERLLDVRCNDNLIHQGYVFEFAILALEAEGKL